MKAYILSGGKSTRMGEDKGLKKLLGKALVSYVLEILKTVKIEVKIIAHSHEYEQFGVPVIADKINEKGPLGGVYTALCDAKEDVLIVSADTPLINAQIINELIKQKRKNCINVICYQNKIQPLCGIYPFSFFKKIENRVQNAQLKMMQLLAEMPTNIVELNGETEVFTNANTPADFAAIELYLKK